MCQNTNLAYSEHRRTTEGMYLFICGEACFPGGLLSNHPCSVFRVHHRKTCSLKGASMSFLYLIHAIFDNSFPLDVPLFPESFLLDAPSPPKKIPSTVIMTGTNVADQ